MKRKTIFILSIALTLIMLIPLISQAVILGNPFPIAVTSGQEEAISAAFDGTNYLVGIQGDDIHHANITAQLISQSGTLVGSRISVGRTGGAPFVAFDGTNYLIVWSDDANHPNDDIYGQFISKTGTLAGTPFAINQAAGYQDSFGLGSVIFDGLNYFVVWNSAPAPDGCTDEYGQFVKPNGQLLGSPIKINQTPCGGGGGTLAYDGTRIFAVWLSEWTSGGTRNGCNGDSCEAVNVVGQFITKSDAVTPGALSGNNFWISESPVLKLSIPSASFDGTNYLAVWTDQVSGNNGDVFGQLVTPAGALSGDAISISTAPGKQFLPFIVFDGTNYLVSWTDMRNDTNGNWSCDAGEGTCLDIYGHFVSKSGALVGSEFIINNDAGNQLGGFVGQAVNGKLLGLVNTGVNGVFGDWSFGDVYGVFLAESSSVDITNLSWQDGAGRQINYDFSSGTFLNIPETGDFIFLPPEAVINSGPDTGGDYFLIKPYQSPDVSLQLNTGAGTATLQTTGQGEILQGPVVLGYTGTIGQASNTYTYSASLTNFIHDDTLPDMYDQSLILIGNSDPSASYSNPLVGAQWYTGWGDNVGYSTNVLYLFANLAKMPQSMTWTPSKLDQFNTIKLTGLDPSTTTVDLKAEIQSGTNFIGSYSLDGGIIWHEIGRFSSAAGDIPGFGLPTYNPILMLQRQENNDPFYVMSAHYQNLYLVVAYVKDLTNQYSAVTLSGPGLADAVSMVYNSITKRWELPAPPARLPSDVGPIIFSLGPTTPNAPLTYTFTTDQETHERKINEFVEDFATDLSMTYNALGMPVFSWTPVQNQNASFQAVVVRDTNVNRIWYSEPFSASQTSIIYNGPVLVQGQTYFYDVVSCIGSDSPAARQINMSNSLGQFTYSGHPALGNPFPIAATTGQELGFSAAFDGTNYLVGISGDETSDDNVTAQLISQSGTLVGSRISTGRTRGVPQISFDGTNYLMAWIDDDDLYGVFISKSGALIGSPFVIQPGSLEILHPLGDLVFGGGNYLVVYYKTDSASGKDIVYGRLISTAGAVGPEIRISTGYGNQEGNNAAFDGVNFFVVWNNHANNTEVKGRFVSPSGTLGTEITVKASGLPNDNPLAVAFDGTNYFVVWTDQVSGSNWDIFGQLVTPAGALSGGAISISTAPGQQFFPIIVFDGTNYLVSWTDMRNDTNGNWVCDPGEGTCWDIYGQFLSRSGTLIGSEFIINNDAGNQLGGFVGQAVNGKLFGLVNTGVITDSEEDNWLFGDVYGVFMDIEVGAIPAAPIVAGNNPSNDNTPTWSWNSGGSGNGTYRYKLDDSNLDTGATITTNTQYTPDTILGAGPHTLYVQEQDDAGNWSNSGSFTITVLLDFIVTSVADSGPGTLRQAITDANANGTADTDTIKFATGLENQTIHLVTELPNLSSNLIIDGTCLPDGTCAPSGSSYAPTIDGSDTDHSSGLYIQDQSNVKIKGLKITGFLSGICFEGNTSNIIMEGNTVVSNTKSDLSKAINFRTGNDVSNIRIINNTVTDGGISISPLLDDSHVHDVEISGNTLTGTWPTSSQNPQSIGIHLSKLNGVIEDVLISGNTLSQSISIGIGCGNCGGDQNNNRISNVTIKHNKLQRNLWAGIESGLNNTISGITIEDNLLENSEPSLETGIGLDDLTSAASNAVDGIIKRNIVTGGGLGVFCKGNVTADVTNNFCGGNIYGMVFANGCNVFAANNLVKKNGHGIVIDHQTNTELVNNLVVENCSSGIGSIDRLPLSGPVFSYNDVWNNGTNYTGISSGATDISLDPKFINADAGDYHLTLDSPCIDAGNPSGIYNDSPAGMGTLRSDIGLYGGPDAKEFDYAVPVVDYISGVTHFSIGSVKVSETVRQAFDHLFNPDTQYLVSPGAESYPCSVSSAKAISPSGLEIQLFDDGNNADKLPNDGDYQGYINFSGYPEMGNWNIQVVSGGQLYSETIFLGVNEIEPPQILQPIDGASNVILTPLLVWHLPDTSDLPDGYDVRIFKGTAESLEYENILFSTEVNDPAADHYQLPAGVLEPGTGYYFMIEPYKKVGSVYYSGMEIAHFTTKPDIFAKFAATPTTGAMPLEVSFTDESMGTNLSWAWVFGDGGTSTERNPTHTYNQTGTYTVKLTVTGDEGTHSTTKTDFISVYEVGSTILNPPDAFDKNRDYAINVRGFDVVAYKYKLDNDSWSSEQLIETPITFTLSNVGPHTLYVLGKNSEGKWQTEAHATTVSWTADFTNPTVNITSPDDGAVVNQINTIIATGSDTVSGISSMEFMVTDGFWFVHVNETSGLATLVPTETWIKAQVMSGNSWYIPSNNFPWEIGKNYTITARAVDKAGNVARDSIYVAYHDINNNPAWTSLFMDLSSQTILNGEKVEVSGKFTRLPEGDPPVSLVGLNITLTITDPDQIAFQQTVSTYDSAGHFELVGEDALMGFTKKGVYTIQANFAGNAALYKAASLKKAVLVGAKAGYAVIVEGKISNGEGVLSHNKTANRIYDKLIDRGFLPDNIYYFNYDNNQDGVDDVPTKAKVQNIIENWIHPKMNGSPAPLFIIFIDHGNRNAFRLNNETISPAELNNWLTVMETKLNTNARKENRVVIIGACYSGTFIPELSIDGRVVITSSASDEESYKGPQEPDGIRSGEFFLEELFDQLWRGKSLKDSFEYAGQQTKLYTHKGGNNANSSNPYFDQAMQHPLLDDNGDKRGSNSLSEGYGDGETSSGIYLGTGLTYDTNSAENPADIVSVTPTLYLNSSTSSATLWATANDDSQVGSAWYEVRSPSTVLSSQGGSGQLEIELDKQMMSDAGVRWEKAYTSFSESGKYEIYYFVRDAITEEVSPMKRSVVYKAKEGNNAPVSFTLLAPLNIGNQGYKEPKTVLIFDWEDAPDPDYGDTVTYNLIIAKDEQFTNEVIRKEELTSSFTYLDYSAGLKDLTTYYWKVEAVDSYGAKTSSSVWSFKTNNTNMLAGFIKGRVYSGSDYNPIPGAQLEASLGGAHAVSFDDGTYIMLVPAGTATVYGTKEGFDDVSIPGIRVKEGQVIPLDVMMQPEGLPPDTTAPISQALPAGGTYNSAVEVTLTCDDGNGSGCSAIYFTLDGSEPTADSPTFSAPVKLTETTVLKFYAKDNAGNIEAGHTETYTITVLAGDLNFDGNVDLEDAILAIQVLTGIDNSADINKNADINDDDRIGLEEVIYILQEVSGLRW